MLPVSARGNVGNGDRRDVVLLGYNRATEPLVNVSVDTENIGLSEFGLGAFLANQTAALFHHVLHIVGLRTGKQMLRIAARLHIACVADELSFRNTPNEMLIAEPMDLESVLDAALRDLDMQVSGTSHICCVTSPTSAFQLTKATQEFSRRLIQKSSTDFDLSATFWMSTGTPPSVVRRA